MRGRVLVAVGEIALHDLTLGSGDGGRGSVVSIHSTAHAECWSVWRRVKRKIFAFSGFLTLIVIIAAVVVPFIEPHNLATHERELRDWIQHNLLTAMGVGILVYTLISLVPATSGKAIVCGWLFGFWAGLLVSIAGLTCAGIIVFAIIRFVFRDAVQAKLGRRLALWEKWVEREGAWCLLTLRMAHVPYSLVNYLAAASRISLVTFVWTTIVGLLPGTVVFVWMGSRLPTIHELLEHGARELLDPWLWAALIAIALLPLSLRVFVRFTHRGEDEKVVEEEFRAIDELAHALDEEPPAGDSSESVKMTERDSGTM